jgi:hypothetical protein
MTRDLRTHLSIAHPPLTFADGTGSRSNELCNIMVLHDATLSTTDFNAVAGLDSLRVGSWMFTGTNVPTGFAVTRGERMTWQTSASGSISSSATPTRHSSFTVCATPVSLAPTPAPEPVFEVTSAVPLMSCFTVRDGACVTGAMQCELVHPFNVMFCI